MVVIRIFPRVLEACDPLYNFFIVNMMFVYMEEVTSQLVVGIVMYMYVDKKSMVH